MESSYEMVHDVLSDNEAERTVGDINTTTAIDLTPSLERTMFRFHQASEPQSPRLDYSPSSASLPLSDTSSPHSPIGSFVEHSDSLANLVLPRLDVMYNEGLQFQTQSELEGIRHGLKVIIVGSTGQAPCAAYPTKAKTSI